MVKLIFQLYFPKDIFKMSEIILLNPNSPIKSFYNWTKVFYNSRTTIEIKLWSWEQYFPRNIFKSKHTLLQLLCMCKWLILKCGQTLQSNFWHFKTNLVSHVKDLKTFQSMPPWQKKLTDEFLFLIFHDVIICK